MSKRTKNYICAIFLLSILSESPILAARMDPSDSCDLQIWVHRPD